MGNFNRYSPARTSVIDKENDKREGFPVQF